MIVKVLSHCSSFAANIDPTILRVVYSLIGCLQ